MGWPEKLTIVAIFAAVAALTWFSIPPKHSIVETRREHLVFEAEGCNVYQVRIKDRDGVRFIYVAVNPATSPRPTTPYVTCRIAH